MVDNANIAKNVERDAEKAMRGDNGALNRLHAELHSLHSNQLEAIAPMLETKLGRSYNRLIGGVEISRNQQGAVEAITFVPPLQDRATSHSVQTSLEINNFVDDAERISDKVVDPKTGKVTFTALINEAKKIPTGSSESTTLAALMQFMAYDQTRRFDGGILRSQLDGLRENWTNFSDLTQTEVQAQQAIQSDRTLWGSKGISADAIHLGPGDDTTFSAVLTDIARHNPARLQHMIKDNHNGTYTVTAAPGHVFEVKAPTDAEMALYNRGGDHGIWPIVLAKAFQQYRQSMPFHPNPLGFLTNKNFDEVLSEDFDRDALTPLFARYLKTGDVYAVPNSFMENKTPDGFPAGRAYSVLAFDPAGPDGGTVTVRNPGGGRDGTPAGEWKISLRSFQVNFPNFEATSDQSKPYQWNPKVFRCPPRATIISCAIAAEHAEN